MESAGLPRDLFEERLRAFTRAIGWTAIVLLIVIFLGFTKFYFALRGWLNWLPQFVFPPLWVWWAALLILMVMLWLALAIWLTCHLWARNLRKSR